jgi:hypothetical protein
MGGDNGGFMVMDNADEFTARVLDLLGDPELHRRKSLEAKTHARAWSIEELTKKLVVIYESTVKSYLEDYGDPRTPVWELLTDKRWWKINNKIFRKRTKQIWHRMRAKIGSRRELAGTNP